jgi:hypothetical protein
LSPTFTGVSMDTNKTLYFIDDVITQFSLESHFHRIKRYDNTITGKAYRTPWELAVNADQVISWNLVETEYGRGCVAINFFDKFSGKLV